MKARNWDNQIEVFNAFVKLDCYSFIYIFFCFLRLSDVVRGYRKRPVS